MFTIKLNNLLELKPLSNQTQIMIQMNNGERLYQITLVEVHQQFTQITCHQFNLYTTMNINQSTYCFHNSKQIQI